MRRHKTRTSRHANHPNSSAAVYALRGGLIAAALTISGCPDISSVPYTDESLIAKPNAPQEPAEGGPDTAPTDEP